MSDTKIDPRFLDDVLRAIPECERKAPRKTFVRDVLKRFRNNDEASEQNREIRLSFERHLEFLQGTGFIRLSDHDTDVELTAKGRIYLQPELAEFANRNLLPDIITRLEGEIRTLTYPEEEKAGLIFRLREAVAKNAPDTFVKLLVEISARMLQPGGHA